MSDAAFAFPPLEANGGTLGRRIAIVMLRRASAHGQSEPAWASDVRRLARHCALLGRNVDLLTSRVGGEAETEMLAERVRLVRVTDPRAGTAEAPPLAERFSAWSEALLRRVAHEGVGYDFIHSHGWDGGLAAQPLADALAVPHGHAPHTLGAWKQRQLGNPPGNSTRDPFAARIAAERQTLNACDLVIADSPAQLDLLARDYEVPSSRLRFLPRGYDAQRFAPAGDAARRALRQRLNFTGKVILAHGPACRNEGFDLLIAAFGLVAAREPKATLHLALDPPAAGEGQRLAAEWGALVRRHEHAARIQIAPPLAEAARADAYRAADLVVSSRRYDSFDLAAIEALACGTPSVTTLHGGLSRVLPFDRSALFVDPFDREDLGIAMTRVLRHPRLRKQLTRAGEQHARSLFAWPAIAQRFLALAESRTEAGLALAADI